MADNFITNAGAGGITFAGDDIGPGVMHPRTKLEFGADGSATDVADSDGARLPVKPAMAATGTRSSVADSAVAVSLLAANANRKGCIITNTSSAILYVGLGTVDPTTTDFSMIIAQLQAEEMPPCFTGQIKGIWGTDPNDGVALVTELT